jgi:hypothetical protein
MKRPADLSFEKRVAQKNVKEDQAVVEAYMYLYMLALRAVSTVFGSQRFNSPSGNTLSKS